MILNKTVSGNCTRECDTTQNWNDGSDLYRNGI